MKSEIPDKCHLIGIGGIGMSGLARLLFSLGVEITGSDESENMLTEALSRDGVKISKGHSADLIDSSMTIVYSSGIPEENQELVRARELGCPLLHRSELLQRFMATRKALAVTGTHGKTTTSAMISQVLSVAEKKPSFFVGGMASNFETNAIFGEGEYFVAEADESDGTFLRYAPYGAIITNIGLDHLNYFDSEEKILQAYSQFASQVVSSRHLLWCGDDKRLCSLSLPGVSYGFSETCQVRILRYEQKGWCSYFDLQQGEKTYHNIHLPHPGKHNVLNAAGVFTLALLLGISEELIRKGISTFRGVKRRTEKKGEEAHVLVLDDYAHHPTEISATISSVREAVKDRRIIAVYEPHRYSRLKHCKGLFKKSFCDADLTFVTDIYSCKEDADASITKESIAKEIGAGVPFSIPVERRDLLQAIIQVLKPHDVVVILGAGSITHFGDELIEHLRVHPLEKIKVGVVRGGKSQEHDISLTSAKFVLDSLDSKIYDVIPFTISKAGEWKVDLEHTDNNSASIFQKIEEMDLFFPVLHGPKGEDGTIQGFFEMLDKPYVGCTYRPSAVCMDKALTKKMMILQGVRTAPFIFIKKMDWKKNPDPILQECQDELSLPIFVKASHLGSSIGVIKVYEWDELPQAIDSVCLEDDELIVEQGIKGREIEFSVVGFDTIEVFHPGEVLSGGQIYDFDSKYINAKKTDFRAKLDPALAKRGMQLAKEAYEAAGCDGFARVDFFLDEQDRFWLNEINPIPGMTPISLFPQIIMNEGINQRELMDRLIQIAIRRAHHKGIRNEMAVTTTF